MKVKTYKTERGAEAFAKRIRDKYPEKLVQVATMISLDFHTIWYVEVLIDNVRGNPAWVAVGPFSNAKGV